MSGEGLSAEERDARDLTHTILRFYGYTDDDIAYAEEIHPGRVCDVAEAATLHPKNSLPWMVDDDDPPTVLALLARLEAAESARDEALAVVERVRALADVVRRLQEPDPDSGDRDVSFFALMDALDPDDAALTPSAPTEETQA